MKKCRLCVIVLNMNKKVFLFAALFSVCSIFIVPVSAVPVREIVVSPFVVVVPYDFKGIVCSGIGSFVDGCIAGVEVSGMFNITNGNLNGSFFSGLFNIVRGDLLGVQSAGLFNVIGGSVKGILASGLFNFSGKFEGFESAAVNISDDCKGMQVGVVNIARDVHGIQLGIVNVSRDVNGMALGLVNISKRGIHKVTMEVTSKGSGILKLKIGTRILYTVFGVGGSIYNLPPGSYIDYLKVACGIGAQFVTRPFFVDFEVLANNSYKGSFTNVFYHDREGYNYYPSFTAILGVPLPIGISLTVGANANLYVWYPLYNSYLFGRFFEETDEKVFHFEVDSIPVSLGTSLFAGVEVRF